MKVGRGKGLTGPVKVELLLPAHVHGMPAEPVVVAADQANGVLTLHFAGDAMGPFNMPLTVRATLSEGADAVTAETKLEITPE